MKFKRKIALLICTILTISISFIAPKQVLAASTGLSANSTTISVGETTAVTASINSTETWSITMSSSGGTLSGTLNSTDAAGAEVSKTVITASFTASTAGTYTISLNGSVAGSDLVKNTVSKSITITVKEKETPAPTPTPSTTPTPSNDNTTPVDNESNGNNETSKSSNNNLKSLSTDVGELTPIFYRDTLSYTLKFDDKFDYKTLASVVIKAEAEDNKSKISGTGEMTVNDGENNFNVKCTAENGSVKTYTIKVTKPVELQQSDLRLKSLLVNKINKEGQFIKGELKEEFSAEKFEYTCDVEDDIVDLDVKAEAEKGEIIIVVDGDQNLKGGKNIVTITLSSPTDETVKTTYTIVVNKPETAEVVTNVIDTNNKSEANSKSVIFIIIVAIIVILAIALITLLIINHKRKKEDEEDHTDIEPLEDSNSINYVDEQTIEEKMRAKNDEKIENEDTEELEETTDENIDETNDIEEKNVEEDKKEETPVKGKYSSKLDELFAVKGIEDTGRKHAAERKKENEDIEDVYDFKQSLKEEKKNESNTNEEKPEHEDLEEKNDDEEITKTKKKKSKGKRFLD